ncbi:hypothetical protein D9613_000125 [Agrocybe pediades]|uniref:Uncharacterized protein n=1 Tax=Agrocybe pediades TaxID=84607 RepID=A0A8H4VUN2_9AGAR|nr:hypothetical protein D9613_000125 [Agrocybe pediades]
MSDSLSHHPHPSPLPLPPASAATRVRLSAEQALSRVSGLDEQKRARYGHRHSNSVGAFSPSAATSSSQQQQKQISSLPSSSTASSSTSSLSFSSSSSSSTSHHHLPGPVHSPFSTLTHTPPSPRPRTPRTPLRSSTTPQYPHAVNTSPRPSPLFQRLLEPFAKTVGALTSSPTTTTTPSATPTNLSFSFLLPPFNNQDNSNMYSPPSPTYMHQQYTASRSERLLRDALMRDEMERNTGATASSSSSSSAISPHANAATSSASGSASASTSPRTHRRRHSHVPTSSTTPALNPSNNAHMSFASSGKLTASPTPLSPPLSTFSPSPNPNATAVAGPPSVAAATAGTHKDRKRRSLNTQASSLTKQQEEDLTRGSFLFRTAMSNPRSMSPSGASSLSGSASAGSASGSRSREEGTSRRSTSKSNESRVAYGGDREADVESLAVLPSTPLQRNGWRRQSVQATATAAGDEQELLLQHDTMHSRSRSAYTGSGTASGPRSTSHSPSPLRRQQRPSSLQRQQRPSPLPLSNNNNNNPNNGHFTPDHNTAGPNTPNSANLQRHHTIHSSPSYRRNAGGAAASTTPETTPSKRPTRAGSRPPPIDLYNHHQQLNSPRRAQQLQSSSYHQTQGLNPASPGEPLIMTPHEQVLRARLERVLEAGKVVEKKEREKRRRSESRGATSVAAANEVRDEKGGWPWGEKERGGRAGGVEVGDESPRTGHSRNRSKTDSALPSLSSSTSGLPPMPATPKRSTTAPAAPTTLSASKIPVLRRQQPRTGTTPPLEGGEDGDEDVEDGDLRLLTPPPTPPFTARIFGNGEYCPSPYKTSYSAGITGPARANAKLGGLGGIRRPQNAPTMHNRQQHQDMDDSHSSCSSSNSHSHGSQQHERKGRRHRSSSSASSSHENDLNTPPSPTPFSASAVAGRHRPQFNARKASARCRAIEGYVSFASVEGLGEPPADPLSPDGDDDEGDGRSGRKRDGRGMLLSMGTWSGWTKRLLGVGATGTGAGTVQREGGGQGEGVVL